MSSVVDQILQWSRSRPLWQRDALRRLAIDGAVDDDTISRYADACLGGAPADLEPLEEAHFRSGAGAAEPVSLVAIREAENVNSLAPGQQLTFAETGLTVVYGDNGTGKSGYARILKSVTRTRAREEVLSDIFRDGTSRPRAVIEYRMGAKLAKHVWTAGESGPEPLSRVSFFDHACSDIYLSKDTEVAFRPFGLKMFDDLVVVCERVKRALETRESAASRKTPGLPALSEATAAGKFLQGLSGRMSDKDVASASEFSSQDRRRLDALEAAIRLQRQGTGRAEARRLELLANRTDIVKRLLEKVDSKLSTAARDELVRLRDDARAKAEAARLARAQALSTAVLPGVGEGAWRALWDAARAYSETSAYPGKVFPVTDGSCVLCHQQLDQGARVRLKGFDAFVRDQTEQAARIAEVNYLQAKKSIQTFAVTDEAATNVIEDLRAEDEATAAAVDEYLRSCQTALEGLQRAVAQDAPEKAGGFPALPSGVLEAAGQRLRARSGDMNRASTPEGEQQVLSEAAELRARKALAEGRHAITAEHQRLQLLQCISDAKASATTHSITQKGAELTNAALTEVLMDRFSRESDRLGLEKVVLRTVGGRRGVLMYRRGFVGAVQDVPLPAVLSEGEQTALGMAGFMAEVSTDDSRSAVVFDDPVSSLDHERRDKVAETLVRLAANRQAVVFTHDVAFVLALKKHAVVKSVQVTERSIEKWQTTPGHCEDYHKFSAKLVKERLVELEQMLAELRGQQASIPRAEYRDKIAKWYRLLRQTWERAIEETLVGDILTRDDLQVHPKMVRTLVLYTAEDNKTLQRGYGRATELSEVHDESAVINAPAPSMDEMEADLTDLRQWHKGVASRKSFSEQKIYELAGQTVSPAS